MSLFELIRVITEEYDQGVLQVGCILNRGSNALI